MYRNSKCIQIWWHNETCKSKGDHLVSIHNKLVNGLTSNQPSCNNYWIGLKCASPSSCSWSDSTDFTFYNWASGQSPAPGCTYVDKTSGIHSQIDSEEFY